MKNNKTPGHDRITNEQIKYGGEILTKSITKLFNKILKMQQVPNDWKLTDTILLYKKGDEHEITNYRPISLSPALAKLFSKAIEQRIRNKMNENQPNEQAGFRKSFSTSDHLQVINQLIEKSQEYQIDLHLLFIDYSKAFDSIEHPTLIKALVNQGVQKDYIKLMICTQV